tara:strand:- start:134 stop:379 length:246 start_codon:yes stop_codon:yes gene_type:complete
MKDIKFGWDYWDYSRQPDIKKIIKKILMDFLLMEFTQMILILYLYLILTINQQMLGITFIIYYNTIMMDILNLKIRILRSI